MLAVGEFDVTFDSPSGFVSALHNMNEHYGSAEDYLAVAQEAFEVVEIQVLPNAVTPYRLGAP